MRSRIYVTVGCPSVCLSHRSTVAAVSGGFAAERGRLQHILIDTWRACSPRSAADAGRVMLRAEGRGSTQTCLLLCCHCLLKLRPQLGSREILLGSIYGVQCVAAFYCMLQWRVQYTGPRDVKTVAVPRWGGGAQAPKSCPDSPNLAGPKNCG